MITNAPQKLFKTLGDGGCLLLCYAYITQAFDERNIFNDFETLVERKIIDRDCFIKDADKLFRFYGVNKIVVRGIIPETNELYIAEWVNGKYRHFVVMKNDKVVFDPLGKSNTVLLGKLSEKRVLR